MFIKSIFIKKKMKILLKYTLINEQTKCAICTHIFNLTKNDTLWF